MKEAYRLTRKDGAPGIDGVTAADYEVNLEANLLDLLDRIKSGRYRAPPVRRAYIPKADGSQRPLGIPTFEDKVAQRAVTMVLEEIYEQDFLPCSYGFRPGRSAHQALRTLQNVLWAKRLYWVLDIDIRKYFDSIPHSHLRTFLDQRVTDGVIRRMIEEVKADRAKNVNTLIITIGKKAAHAANRISGVEVEAHYQELGDKPDADAIRPVLNSLISMFTTHKVDAVDLIHTRFISTIVQKIDTQRLLPAGFEEVELSDDMSIADIEPSAEVLVRIATERLIEAQVYQALLDSKASEHSMRMLAMKSATDNASDLIEDLTLAFNNARQAAITQELAEISGGVEAMK